jgi:hypothetical protein
MERHRKTYDRFVVLFKEKGLNITTTFEEFDVMCVPKKQTNKIRVDYIARCGHRENSNIASVLYKKDFSVICIQCIVYSRYKKLFEDKKCELLTSYEDFVSIGSTLPNYECLNVEYKAACGHLNIGGIKPFKEGWGENCKECNNLLQQSSRMLEDGSSGANSLEDDNISILIEKLKDKYNIKLTDDGCLADLAIKHNKTDDKWLMVQIKSTGAKSDRYSYVFKGSDKYKNCLILCICNEKMWHFNGNNMKTKTISISRSRKFENEIKNSEELCTIIDEYVKNIPLFKFDEINIPISRTTKVEQIYRIHRETKCNFLDFVCPNRTNLRYDFTVNGYKVQEKVGGLYNTSLNRTSGNNTKYPYKKGENDFYWIHMPCKRLFLLFPEGVLIDDGYIETENQNGRNAICYNLKNISEKDNKWNKYLFDYENLEEERLGLMFSP